VSDDRTEPADPLASVRRSFDDIANAYAREFADELARKPFDSELLDRFAGGLPAPARVLDLGCGAAGHIGRFVRDRGARVTGIDFSERSIEIARGLHPDLDFAVADLRAMPFADGSVDAAVAFYCLIYGSDEDVVAALAETRRVLRRGGRLLAAVHGALDGRARDEHFETFDDVPIDVTLRLTTPAAFAALVERAGLRIDEMHAREPYDLEHPSRRIYVLASRAGD
jgi:SAM-dependent methyltransferase